MLGFVKRRNLLGKQLLMKISSHIFLGDLIVL